MMHPIIAKIISPIYIFWTIFIQKNGKRNILGGSSEEKILVKKPISVAFSENVSVNSGANIAFVFRRKKDNK